MAAVCCAGLIRRLIDDLTQFEGGREIPHGFLKFFSLTFELAYQELLVLDFFEDLNSTQKEVIDILRQCLVISRQLNMSEIIEPPSVSLIYAGAIGHLQL